MKVEILGCVQDAGVPHLGCNCKICLEAHENKEKIRYVSAIMLKENEEKNTARYIIDATPDIRFQVKAEYIDGVFVPHAELGHSTGLLYFGQEGPDATDLNVYCSSEMEDFLMKNDPYRFLVDRNNIEIQEFENGDTESIQGGKVTALQFYHPHIGYDTTGYLVEGEEKSLFYLSDITEFTEEVLDAVNRADIAIIDGTFWSAEEIDRFEEVPHPTIKDSMEKLSGSDTEVYFTHLNHTNPVLRESSDERAELEDKGFHVAKQGLEFDL